MSTNRKTTIIKGFYRYTLQEIRSNGEPARTRCFDWSFNKSKLIGSVVLMGGRRYRVILQIKKKTDNYGRHI